jgi:hypothetical protein
MDTSTTGRTVSASDANPLVERPWWQLGIVGGIAAALLNLVVYWLAVGAADVNLQVSTAPGSDELQDLAIPPLLIASLLPGLLAAGLAALLAARTAAPRRWFVAIAVVLLVLSFFSIFPLDISSGATITLIIMHTVPAIAIMAALLPRLTAEEVGARR